MAVPRPACPEPGVNLEEDWELTDKDLKYVFVSWTYLITRLIFFSRHIIQLYIALNRTSASRRRRIMIQMMWCWWRFLFVSRLIHPSKIIFIGLESPKWLSVVNFRAEYVTNFVLFNVKKCTCAHLNTVNMQDKIKFKNCNITGVINANCHHILILSMVDLQKGERYLLQLVLNNRSEHHH